MILNFAQINYSNEQFSQDKIIINNKISKINIINLVGLLIIIISIIFFFLLYFGPKKIRKFLEIIKSYFLWIVTAAIQLGIIFIIINLPKDQIDSITTNGDQFFINNQEFLTKNNDLININNQMLIDNKVLNDQIDLLNNQINKIIYSSSKIDKNIINISSSQQMIETMANGFKNFNKNNPNQSWIDFFQQQINELNNTKNQINNIIQETQKLDRLTTNSLDVINFLKQLESLLNNCSYDQEYNITNIYNFFYNSYSNYTDVSNTLISIKQSILKLNPNQKFSNNKSIIDAINNFITKFIEIMLILQTKYQYTGSTLDDFINILNNLLGNKDQTNKLIAVLNKFNLTIDKLIEIIPKFNDLFQLIVAHDNSVKSLNDLDNFNGILKNLTDKMQFNNIKSFSEISDFLDDSGNLINAAKNFNNPSNLKDIMQIINSLNSIFDFFNKTYKKVFNTPDSSSIIDNFSKFIQDQFKNSDDLFSDNTTLTNNFNNILNKINEYANLIGENQTINTDDIITFLGNIEQKTTNIINTINTTTNSNTTTAKTLDDINNVLTTILNNQTDTQSNYDEMKNQFDLIKTEINTDNNKDKDRNITKIEEISDTIKDLYKINKDYKDNLNLIIQNLLNIDKDQDLSTKIESLSDANDYLIKLQADLNNFRTKILTRDVLFIYPNKLPGATDWIFPNSITGFTDLVLENLKAGKIFMAGIDDCINNSYLINPQAKDINDVAKFLKSLNLVAMILLTILEGYEDIPNNNNHNTNYIIKTLNYYFDIDKNNNSGIESPERFMHIWQRSFDGLLTSADFPPLPNYSFRQDPDFQKLSPLQKNEDFSKLIMNFIITDQDLTARNFFLLTQDDSSLFTVKNNYTIFYNSIPYYRDWACYTKMFPGSIYENPNGSDIPNLISERKANQREFCKNVIAEKDALYYLPTQSS